ncbi:MAG: TolC family protein, partial [Burkholderiaceae bacterium]|nr:TolC family protein [Burkholderiaceae bacterium]
MPIAKPAKRLLAAWLTTALLFQTGSASALGLIQAYDAALRNDPTFQAARFENEAGQQNRPMGRAGLLPQLSASYYGAKNNSDVTYLKYYQGKDVTIPRDYNSRNASVQLRQSVINLEGIARYRQGAAQSDYSDAVFAGKSEDLILR